MAIIRFFKEFQFMKLIIGALDYFCFQFSLALGYFLWVRFPWHGHWQYFSEFSVMLWVLPPLAIIVFKSLGLYKPEMGVMGVHEQSSIFKAIWVIYVIVFSFSFFYRDVQFSRLATLYSMFFAIITVSLERFLMRRAYILLNRYEIGIRRAVIYGAGFNGQRLERWIRQTPQMGIQVVGFLDDNPDVIVKKPEFGQILGGLNELSKIVKEKKVSLFFIAHRTINEEKVVEMLQLCRQLKVRCWVIPSLYHFHVERVEIQNIGGIPLVGFREQFGRHSYEMIKFFLDEVTAIILMILALPIWIIVGFGTLVTLGPPIYFKQIRIGKDGKKFTIYKFRTLKMGTSKDAISPELQKKSEKITTPFGAFLRQTGLDEVPQLINVLKGDMSIVGPRPEMPFLVEKYGPLERERLLIKPGITGLWQISDDRKRLLIHENMDYDLYYAQHMSFNLDLAVLCKTAATIAKRIFFKPAGKVH